jgi:hypothetical protein
MQFLAVFYASIGVRAVGFEPTASGLKVTVPCLPG